MQSSKITGLVLALVLGAAGAGVAQETPRQKQEGAKAKQEWQGKRGAQGRGFGVLLKGIELTDAQKEQLKALHAKRGNDMPDRDALKAARERGDTAVIRQMRTQHAAAMKERHEQMLTEVRAILTPAQREIFDRNAAEAKKRVQDGLKERKEHRSKHHS